MTNLVNPDLTTIGLAGGSGFVGMHLASLLKNEGYQVIIFSRGKAKTENGIRFAQWNPADKTIDQDALKQLNAMVNLAGAGVMDHRWISAYKKEIIESRVGVTSFLLNALQKHGKQCSTYLSASATGIYGPDEAGNPPFKEDAPPYPDFLGNVCVQWEAAAQKAAIAFRTLILRFGIILGKGGGAYEEFAGPMKFGVVPILAGGKQVVPWVHLDDVARMILFTLKERSLSGTFNCVAPNPVNHLELMKALAAAKGGLKIRIPVPQIGLQLLLGESSIEILKSCTASSAKIQQVGFKFRYPTISDAAQELTS